MAVEQMKRGAVDFLQKTVSAVPLQAALEHALQVSAAAFSRQEIICCYQQLTPKERELAHLVAKGLMNREIADAMNIAVRTVEVTVRQLDKLNSLLDGALKAGLNEIRSVSLGVAQPEKYKDEARKAAIDDAIHQAEQLASGFKSKLGPVYSVRYHVSNYQPSPMVRMMKADAAPVSAQETYEQPTIQFDDQVDVVFQLEPTQTQQTEAAKAQ